MIAPKSRTILSLLSLLWVMDTASVLATETTSVSGIVVPNQGGKVVAYRIPKLLEYESLVGETSSSSFTLQSSIVPTSAIGVFLRVNAGVDGYLGLTAVNDLPTAPAGLEDNFLQIGLPSGGYVPPAGMRYEENNVFYLPLKQGVVHTIQWKIMDRDDGANFGSYFAVYCMGYIE